MLKSAASNLFLRSGINRNIIRSKNIRRRRYIVRDKDQAEMVQQAFDYFLVLDFEATCEENRKIQPIQEIIEFPVVQIDSRSLNEVAYFHHYVKPTERPFLSSFCTNLTGILQESVDKSDNLPAVLQAFSQWLIFRGLLNSGDNKKLCSWALVTCGDWDLGVQLPQEAKYRGYFNEWVNIKKAFAEAKGYFPNSLSVMLRDLNIKPIGRLHSGIDDVRNICAVLKVIASNGYVLHPTVSAVSETPFASLSSFGLLGNRIGMKKVS